jgi:hypothetical protein
MSRFMTLAPVAKGSKKVICHSPRNHGKPAHDCDEIIEESEYSYPCSGTSEDEEEPVSPCALGYQGRFSSWAPGHVVLESSDGHKFSVPKAALRRSRYFIAHLFLNHD